MQLDKIEQTIKYGIVATTAALAAVIITLPGRADDTTGPDAALLASPVYGPAAEARHKPKFSINDQDGNRWRIAAPVRTIDNAPARPLLTISFTGGRLLPDAGSTVTKRHDIAFDRDRALIADYRAE
ncbi:MAG: hypothetical protein EP335_05240 [Alphaproteobacteria bacterium]|nr:MAG: hypothetical protein EP335_05240 [Alphaproteobacteria bacterium]